MSDFQTSKSTFLKKVVAIIEDNLADEHFGVTELADSISMSRSNLLRKVKQETGESVSVLIRNVRLHNAKQLLKDDTLTVSEISYQVGFSSTSYFTKCFRELYGYTPGEAGSRAKLEQEQEAAEEAQPTSQDKRNMTWPLIISSLAIVAVMLFFYFDKQKPVQNNLSKSIAVLPFKNDSADSTNIYFMNGLMEAILDNFQKIEDIKVTSRTTVEKYRGIAKTIPELSKELNVSYFIEGSGQKIGNEILLTIQLIEAPSDKHLWSKRYKREINDVFELQSEVAKSIAGEINAIITPAERERIEKIPTNNLVAYDHYLKGKALLDDETGEGLREGLAEFKKAIQEDGQFAQAYAYIAISYYYLDLYQTEQKYTEDLKSYADKAMELDSALGESLIARSLYYMQTRDFNKAIDSFEEVLEYYPNVAWVHNFLSNIYGLILPDTEKYLTHALQGIRVAVAGQDSATASYTYLHLSNALAQSGFINEAETYIKKSLEYNPDNLYSQYLYVYIKMARDFDLVRTKKELLEVLAQDTTRVDIIQEVAKVCYTMKDYKEAWQYYDRFIKLKEALQLDIYQSEDIKIGYVLEQLGRKEEAKRYYNSYLKYAENDQSMYRDLSLSAYYATMGDTDKAMDHLKAFSEQDNYQYWIVLFLDKDPIIPQMTDHPDYQKVMKKIKDKFWAKHKEIRVMLEKKDVIQPLKGDL
ncbi:helix-turn-helix domain-containing protein [Fulvivirga lutimaris]|uniref:helix-turn-helix domain-containing protein n=1 Tax=Fulvivirga lutimaris TaxID=1819566 RepID=UPI0012BCE9B4|nr:helix-turn-helix domain-containing protein [Fulvivirga lutimaris]MTI41815.1 helix-turn-helix domain-containing protein [Fulvivirga lutimaris]